MALDKEAKREFIKNLKSWLSLLNKVLNDWIKRFEKARSEEDLMSIKKSFLLSYIDFFPLSGSECYFCIAKEKGVFLSCEECPYGKKYGICNQEESNWSVIQDQLKTLRAFISDYYYKEKKGGKNE